MEQKAIPNECILYIIIFSAIVLGFICFAIYPFQKSLSVLERELTDITGRIEKQKIISPFFKDLLIKTSKKKSFPLPFPRKVSLNRDKAQQVPSLLKDMALESDLWLIKVDPDVRLLPRNGHDLLSLNIFLKGDFRNFRRFLIRLGEISCLENVEEIQIESIEESYLLRLKIHFNIEK